MFSIPQGAPPPQAPAPLALHLRFLSDEKVESLGYRRKNLEVGRADSARGMFFQMRRGAGTEPFH